MDGAQNKYCDFTRITSGFFAHSLLLLRVEQWGNKMS